MNKKNKNKVVVTKDKKNNKIAIGIVFLCVCFFVVGLLVGNGKEDKLEQPNYHLVNPYQFCEIHNKLNVSYCVGDITTNCIGNDKDLVAYSTDVLATYLVENDYVEWGD